LGRIFEVIQKHANEQSDTDIVLHPPSQVKQIGQEPLAAQGHISNPVSEENRRVDEEKRSVGGRPQDDSAARYMHKSRTSENVNANREKAPDKALVSLADPQSSEAEHFRMLRSSILYPPSGKAPQSILVTSSRPGDGKSFVAANLAISIAQNLDTPVLLVDCDLRKPSLHRLFGLSSVPGLVEYLSTTREIEPFLRRTGADRLYLLPAGKAPRNPSELLASERMISLMRDLVRMRKYFIILDSPPSTMTADPSILAKMVSGILLVTRYGKTRLPEAQLVVDKLGQEKFIGHVINCYEHSLREYYGYRKYSGYGTATQGGIDDREVDVDGLLWKAGSSGQKSVG
jgi:protein-tyrosine kinase